MSTDEDTVDNEFSMAFSFVEDEETTHLEEPNIEKSFQTINLEDGVVLELSDQLIEDMSISVVKPTPVLDMFNLPSTSKAVYNANQPPSHYLTITEGVKIKLSEQKYEKYFRKLAHCLSDVVEEDEAIIDTDSDDEHSDADSSSEKKKESSSDEKKSSVKKKRSHRKKDPEKTSGDLKPSTTQKKKKRSKSKTKDKNQKESDEISTSSKTSISQEPKKKRRKKSESKEPETKDNTDEDDSSDDEEIKKINQAASKIPTYKSIKNLTVNHYYKVLDLLEVETSKGKTIRLKLEDADVEDKWCYVHMPRSVLVDMVPVIQKLKDMCESEKGLYFKFRGMKGLHFKIKFTRHP